MGKYFITTDKKHYITRVSRWITINQSYNLSPRNSLYYYATDSHGNKTGSEEFDPSEGTFLDWFRYNGRTYAIDQFYTIGSMFLPGDPLDFVDTDGSITRVAAVDMNGDLYDPLYLELDTYCERVRLYKVDLIR